MTTYFAGAEYYELLEEVGLMESVLPAPADPLLPSFPAVADHGTLPRGRPCGSGVMVLPHADLVSEQDLSPRLLNRPFADFQMDQILPFVYQLGILLVGSAQRFFSAKVQCRAAPRLPEHPTVFYAEFTALPRMWNAAIPGVIARSNIDLRVPEKQFREEADA